MIEIGTRLTLSRGSLTGLGQAGPTVGEAPSVDSNTARVGTLLTATGGTYLASGGGSVSVVREWLSAGVWSATGLTDTPVVADHGNSFVYRETATEVGGRSPGSVILQVPVGNVIHVAPVAAGGLADLDLIAGSAMTSVDISAGFIGQDITITLTSGTLPAGLLFDGATLSGTPTGTASALLTFTGTNTGGIAATTFQVDVAVVGVTADILPVMGALVAGAAITSEAGTDGSYSGGFPGETFGAPTVEYRINFGSWTVSPGNAVDGQVIDKRTTVLGSAGTTGQFVSGTITVSAAAPDAFGAGDWHVVDAGTGGVATVTILNQPASNGDPINDIEYDVNASNTWLSGGGIQGFDLPGLTDGQPSNIRIRPVNGIGAGPGSPSKTVTTSSAVAPIVNSYSYDGTGTIIASLDAPGNWYWMVDDNMTRTAAQVVAGGGMASGDFAVSFGANSDDIDLSLAAVGLHYLHGVPVNVTGISSDAQVQSSQYSFPGSVPDAFAAGNWTLTNPDTGGDLLVSMNALPAANSDPITDVEYRVDGGSWVSSGGTGSFTISGLPDGALVDIELQAVSVAGDSGAGDLKAQTPTGAGVPDVAVGTIIARNDSVSTGTTFTFSNSEFPAHKILVGVYCETNSDAEFSTVTVGGAPAAAVPGTFVDLAVNNLRFYEATPTAGNNGEIVVTMSATTEYVGFVAWSVDSLTNQAGNADSTNGSRTVRLNTNTTSGEHVFVLGFDFSSNNVTLNGVTEQFDERSSQTGLYHHGGYGTASGGSPESFSITRSGSNTNVRGILATYS